MAILIHSFYNISLNIAASAAIRFKIFLSHHFFSHFILFCLFHQAASPYLILIILSQMQINSSYDKSHGCSLHDKINPLSPIHRFSMYVSPYAKNHMHLPCTVCSDTSEAKILLPVFCKNSSFLHLGVSYLQNLPEGSAAY